MSTTSMSTAELQHRCECAAAALVKWTTASGREIAFRVGTEAANALAFRDEEAPEAWELASYRYSAGTLPRCVAP